VQAATEHAARHNKSGRNIYIGLNPRKPDTPLGKAASEKDVYGAFNSFADIDNGSDARETLLGLDLRPTFIVVTGGAYPNTRAHGYWPMPEITEDLGTWSARQKTISRALGSDPIVHDPPRIARLAGTISYPDEKKRKTGRQPELTYLIRVDDAPISTEGHKLGKFFEDLAQTRGAASTNEAGSGGQGAPPKGTFSLGCDGKAASTPALIAQVTLGEDRWRTSLLTLTARWINEGRTDDEILSLAPIFTRDGYTVDHTFMDMKGMLDGWRQKHPTPEDAGSGWEKANVPQDDRPASEQLCIKPFSLPSVATVEPRQWLFGSHLVRGYPRL
jgi:hypothetical protein